MPAVLALAASLLVGAAFSFAPTDAATGPERNAFRRPSGTIGIVSAEADPVWRLGRRLFFDPNLSGTSRTSCATCHPPDNAWSGRTSKAVGDQGATLAFRTPTLLGIGRLMRLGWTGKFADTNAVSVFAMTSATNMGVTMETLQKRLAVQPSYVADFKDAFGVETTDAKAIGRALTRYVDSITPAQAPFDRWIAGDEAAIDVAAQRGFDLFVGKGRCAECHTGWTFTDGAFHDIGTSRDDVGRGKTFKTSVVLQYAFKTPTLRDVATRSPYMHDGSLATLSDVVDFYDRGGIDRPSRAAAIGPLHLTAAEKADLVSFLESLSGGTDFIPTQ